MSEDSPAEALGSDAAPGPAPVAAALKALVSVGFFASGCRERRELFRAADEAIKAKDAELGDNFIKGLCR